MNGSTLRGLALRTLLPAFPGTLPPEWALRLTREEAAAEVRHRDERRSGFLARVLASETAGLTAYDVVVNSARLAALGLARHFLRHLRSYASESASDHSSSRARLPPGVGDALA